MPQSQFLRPSDSIGEVTRAHQQGRDAALLHATTELFAQSDTHDRDEMLRFEELAIHFLPRVKIADRARIADRLSLCSDSPIAVMRMLARDVVEVASPVLRRFEKLDSFDLLSVVAATGPEHHRLIARRKALGDDVKRALRLTRDVEVLTSLADGIPLRPPAPIPTESTPGGAQDADFATPLEDKPSVGHPRSGIWDFLALDRKARLRAIAEIAGASGSWMEAPETGGAARAFNNILNAAQIVGFVRKGQQSELIGAIAGTLDLPADAVASALNDSSGEALAVLLKAMRLDEIQAQQVFLLASPVGRDVQAFFPLTDLYAGMEHATAEVLCTRWRAAPAERRAIHEQHFTENGDRRRPAALPDTQRRIPGDRQESARRA
jgi:hypothetical protein